MLKHLKLVACLSCFFVCTLHAQDDGYVRLSLNDLSDFKPQKGNWQIVKDVVMDPTVKPHHAAESTTRKNKKKKKSEELPAPIRTVPGTGVLINLPSDTQKDNILTTWEHGDLVLELEVMLPPGSNSGIFLQGRYEIQLFDSYGVTLPQFSDIGGIYRNWEQDIQKSYMGKAPLLNAAKAPGLWQTMKIDFKAPRFDDQGNKIANARIQEVVLNGVVIHKNVELPTYTGGQISKVEAPMGPLLIQGDHGAVAFRNIRYKKMKEGQVQLSDLQYEVRSGRFESEKEFAEGNIVASGQAKSLTYEVADGPQQFGVRFTGKLTVPQEDRYAFQLFLGCVGVLKIDGKLVAEGYDNASGEVQLSAGTHEFELLYSHFQSWRSKRLGLLVATANTHWQDLHAFSSFPPGGGAVAPILVDPGSKPRLLRAFAHHPEVSGVLTHTVGVGNPQGVHFLYDQNTGTPVCAWRGGFVDATPMWHDRGNATFKPRGLTQYLSPKPSIKLVGQQNPREISSKGYKIDPESGQPAFSLEVDGVSLEDKITPGEDGRLIRQVSAPEGQQIQVDAAVSAQIKEVSRGLYAIGDAQYYIEVPKGMQSELRTMGDQKVLVVSSTSETVSYSLIW